MMFQFWGGTAELNARALTRLMVFAVLSLIWIGPTVVLVVGSFLELNLANPSRLYSWVGLRNYFDALANRDAWLAVGRSIAFIFVSTGVSALSGALLALAMYGLPPLAARFSLAIVTLPLFLPPLTGSLVWYFQFNPDYGPLGYYFFRWTGITPLGPGAAPLFLCVVEVWRTAPIFAILYFVALRGTPRSLIDVASIYGTPLATSFWWLFVRRQSGLVGFSLVLGVIHVSKSFESIFIMTRGGPGTSTETFVIFAHKVIFERFNLGVGAAYGVLYDVVVLVLVRLLLKEREAKS